LPAFDISQMRNKLYRCFCRSGN